MTSDKGRMAAAALLLGAAVAAAQPPAPDPASVRGDSPQTRKRLAEAEAKVIGGKAADAVEDLQRVLDDPSDDFVALDARQLRPARRVAHVLLAKLRGEALKAYQDRTDEPARKLLAAGKKDRDPRPLWTLLDNYFVSRPAGEALLLLGELSFERGDFRTAELLWRRLLPDGDVPYPEPKADPAAVRARVVLAVIFQGEKERAAAELAAFRAKHPKATGPFAGKDGPIADALQSFLDAGPRLAPEANADRTWPTFGGGPDRAGRVPGRLPIYWPGKPTWPATFEKANFGRSTRQPYGHPVIADGQVFVTDGARIVAFDLLTGSPSVVADGKPLPDSSCSLTAADGRLYARFGPPQVRTPDAKQRETAIACFGPSRKELWRIAPPPTEPKVPSVWEGAPLVSGRRMWAAVARFESGRMTHAVACYDPADADRAPDRPAWVTEVSDSPLSQGAEVRMRQELLTLAGRNVVLNTNAGAVVALDAATGRRAWAFKYARTAKRVADANRSPDPSPAVAFGGRVFVAPADADRVYALDAETGDFLWESSPTEGAQILGVSRGRVVVTVTGPVKGIRGLSVVTGSHQSPDGWAQHDGGGLATFGRGLATDDVIAWPTKDGLFFLRPDDGLPLRDPLRTPQPWPQSGQFGHLAYADGCLVVVTPTQVWGFVSEAKRFGALDAAERHLADGNTPAARDALAAVAKSDLPPRVRAWAEARLLTMASVDGFTPSPDLLDEPLLGPKGELTTLRELDDGPRRDGSRPTTPETHLARKPEDAPALAFDAAIERTVSLPPSACPLLPVRGATRPAHVFALAGSELIGVSLDRGEKRFFCTADPVTHAADFAHGVVAAGPLSVAVYAAGPRPDWVFRLPDPPPLPRLPDEPRDIPHLSSFVLAGPWLYARVGEYHLVALDLTAKRVAWVLGSHGRARFEPFVFPNCPRFEPHFFVNQVVVVPQLSDGRRWTIDAFKGRVLNQVGSAFVGSVPAEFGHPTSQVAWPAPPASLEWDRAAFADGPNLLRAVEPSTGRVKWSYTATDDASLTGEPPQARAWGDVVLIAVRRNHGVELDRARPGGSAWLGGPVFFEAERIDLSAADIDHEHLFVPVGENLHALTLNRGKPVWEADLPETNGAARWVVRAGRKAVIAYPAMAIPAEPVADVWERFVRSLPSQPFGWRLPAVALGLYDAWVARTVPVLLFDPESGELRKRLDLPARGPGVAVWLHGDRAVIATGDRVVWLK